MSGQVVNRTYMIKCVRTLFMCLKAKGILPSPNIRQIIWKNMQRLTNQCYLTIQQWGSGLQRPPPSAQINLNSIRGTFTIGRACDDDGPNLPVALSPNFSRQLITVTPATDGWQLSLNPGDYTWKSYPSPLPLPRDITIVYPTTMSVDIQSGGWGWGWAGQPCILSITWQNVW